MLKYPNYQYQPRKANEKKRRMTKRKAALMKKQSKDSKSGGPMSSSEIELPEFDSQSAREELVAYVSTLKIQKEQSKKPIFDLPNGENAFNIQLGNVSPKRANFIRDLNEKIHSGENESNKINSNYLIQSVSETPLTAHDDDLCRINSDGFMCNEMTKFSDEDEAFEEEMENYVPHTRAARSIQELIDGPFDISAILNGNPYINDRVEEFAILERQRQVASGVALEANNPSRMVDDIYDNERAANPQAFAPYFNDQIIMESSGQANAINGIESFDRINYNEVSALELPVNTNSTIVHNDDTTLDPELSLMNYQVGNNAVNNTPSSSTAISNDSQESQLDINAAQITHPVVPAQNAIVGPNEMSDFESMLLELQAEAQDQEQGIETADFNNLFVNGVSLAPVDDGFANFEHL